MSAAPSVVELSMACSVPSAEIEERNMIKRNQASGLARVSKMPARPVNRSTIGMVGQLARPFDPLKIVDGLPAKRIVPHDDPDGLPGHGRYGAAY